ncbi:SgcJ/EcaC family oxidoreductase [Massilia sp. TS11]|uniref:YybH family protein n=1 Tax=Massilia sp. TS11 TaxID=2908003 RepID=UPI001EDAFD38|nr:SgcJ/EcaC family oxidoreductase [Massilia sp. TS11]MCG2583605.1 nuclear transport factor 2 family protein [Massilia sp. TS11]
MSFIRRLGAVLLLLCASAVQAADLPLQLQQLADQTDQAWNTRDAQRLAGYYADDASFSISGRALSGRAAIADYFKQSLAAVPAGITHRTEVRRVEALGPYLITDNAVFLEQPGADGSRRLLREFHTIAILRRAGEGWTLAAVRAIALGAPAQATRN